MLPPEDLCPDRPHTSPGPSYPATFNLAGLLLDSHVDGGRGHRTAIASGSTVLSYKQLQTRVRFLAGGLKSAGCRPGDRVVLRLVNSPDLVALWLATQLIGAVAVTTSPLLRALELAAIIDDVRPRLIVTAPELTNDVPVALSIANKPPPRALSIGSQSVMWPTDHDSLEALAARSTPIESAYGTGADDIAIIAYTVGADGRCRGACHSPGDVVASADRYARQVLGLRDTDIVGGHPPIAFTYGLGALLVFPLRCGARSVLTERFDAEELLGTIERERVTVFFGTPTCYRLLMRLPGFPHRFSLGSLRFCVSAGEPLGPETSAAWRDATGVDLVDGLGTTELFHIVVTQRPGDVRHGSIGRPVPGYEVRVVDDELCDMPDGGPGLLSVRGPTGCRYWNRLEAQREYVRGGWNLTGDIVRVDPEGYLWFVGRRDDLIVSAGYNIGPPEIEALLLQHPAVAAVAVVAAPDPIRGAVPKAFVVTQPDATPGGPLALALLEHASKKLAGYKRPRLIEFVSALPMLDDGRVDRAALRAPTETTCTRPGTIRN